MMNEEDFALKLIVNGWEKEDAEKEAKEQFNNEDCDGDLTEMEQLSLRPQEKEK